MIREEELPQVPVCPGCLQRDRVRRYDLSDGEATLEVCWCERCGSWLSAIPTNVAGEGEGVSER